MSNETLDYLNRIHAADRAVMEEIEKALPAIAAVADEMARRMRVGGRCIYVGAGTSGRLAAVDAAELPPTFGLDAGRVVALMAGGDKALRTSTEGAEDDPNVAVKDLKRLKLKRDDVVIAIAASGTTPYVLAALRLAREKGAGTVGLVCNPGTPIAELCDQSIELHTGAEVVSGSTRMKAGSAQKMVLTMLSTTVMRSLGLIYKGEMVGMRPTNTKLRARATRIVVDLLSVERSEAEELLETSNWDLPIALIRGIYGIDVKEAQRRLADHDGNIAATLAAGQALLDAARAEADPPVERK